MKVKLAVFFIGLLFGFLFVSWALQTVEVRVSSVGQVKTVGLDAYEDANLTIPLTAIDWGTIEPSANKSVQIYIQSSSNAPIFLWLSTENWVPMNATSWISLSWDYGGSLLQPNESMALTLTLAISENVTNIQTFSMDIVITGEG